VTLPPVEPPPAREAIVLLKLLRSKLAPATFAKLTALLAEKAFAAPACKLPALICVVPEYVLAPVNCWMSVPVPVRLIVKPPVPLIIPA